MFKNKLAYIIAIFLILFTILFLQINKIEPFESFSLRFNDRNFDLQKKEPNKDVVFVAVDEKSVNKFGRWPWKREDLAKGIVNLSHADVVLMDMIFSEQTDEKNDNILAESISGLNNSVCGFFLRHTSTQEVSDDVLEILGDSSLDLLQSQISEYTRPQFISAPHAEINNLSIISACTLSGSFSTIRGSDHLLRSYPISVYYKNILYPSLAIQGLRLNLDSDISRANDREVNLDEKIIHLDSKGFVRLNYYNYEQYNVVSFLDLVTGKVKPEFFKNKIVILGITDVGAGDVVSTPIGSIPGPLLHYTFISNFLEGHMIVEYQEITSILIILMSILPLALILFFKKTFTRALLNISVYLFIYIGVKYLFIVDMIYIDLFYPLLSLIISHVVVEIIAFNIQEKSGAFIKGAFSSYLSGDLLKQLIKDPKALSIGGETKELTILFSDIRGFTNMSESMKAVDLVKLLNRYFTPMTDIVLENKGMLDKYIGDAIMAFFNAPIDVKNHADAACKAALDMINKLTVLNKELEREKIPPIGIGVGINTANVVVGNMGSSTRFNYTVIGDGVNLASRVEGLTKNYGIDILITEFTVKQLKTSFLYREIEEVKVKGKNKSVLIYELMQDTQESKKIKKLYDEALQKYKENDTKVAKTLFNNLVEKYEDNPSKYFVSRIERNISWGIHTLTTK